MDSALSESIQDSVIHISYYHILKAKRVESERYMLVMADHGYSTGQTGQVIQTF